MLLTEDGRHLADGLFEEHIEWIASLFAGFTAPERETLSTFLHRIRGNIEAGAGRQSTDSAEAHP